MLSQTKIQELMSKFAQVNVNQIKDKSLRAKAVKLKKKQAGFTLLELLVVVAILAAIAGTATIALKDTDMRASAAAHVAMMDELNKGIRTYRVIKKNVLPSRFDSLLTETGTDPGMLGFDPAVDAVIDTAIPGNVANIMIDGGLDELMYIDADYDDSSASLISDGATAPCSAANIQATITSRANAVVAGNIFMTPSANGCGVAVPLTADTAFAGVLWNGGSERLTGQEDPAGANSAYNAEGNYAYLITGIGPSSTLFDANELGGMTTVPIYRHVSEAEYGRFMAVWNIGTYDDTGAIVAGDQLELVTIVDGALDTKEEELGEWDGTRNTI
ncbi:type II secretion system protein [Thiomicrorhabdus sp.]|uniref:type II secretion system protein n=1 Tax=Thiomicrorhabdus sp. TaxID=2039724 RepID=UPI0029C6BC97|nr:type II secretion system protein [Thiomicrorhabdus sp.]